MIFAVFGSYQPKVIIAKSSTLLTKLYYFLMNPVCGKRWIFFLFYTIVFRFILMV